MANLSTKTKLERINNDPRLWMKNFVKIVDNNGDLISFILNDQQQYFLDNMEKKNIILKSRQLGFTTFSVAYCLYMAIQHPMTNYLIVSYKQDSTLSIFEKIKKMYADLPHDKYLFPAQKRNNRNELLLENGSRICCITAGNKDISRGTTYTYVLLSEFAFYQNQENVLVACEQALAKNSYSRIVIETTANGYNHFQKLFMAAYRGNSAYKAFFFNWYDNKTQFKAEYDEAEAWWRANNHGVRFTKTDFEKGDEVLYKNGAQLNQICWKNWKLLDMSEEAFNQEYPATPENAFVGTSQSVFDVSKIIDRINNAPPPLKRTELEIELPESLNPYFGKGLFFYKNPIPGERYFAGVDTASGAGNNSNADNSTISIFDSNGEQVAVFFDNKTPVYKFARIVNDLCKYVFNYAFICCERNSYGLGVLERIKREYGYLNLYKQKVFDSFGKKKLQLGYTTTTVSKAKLINDMKEEFEENMILINDIHTLEEMKIFVDVDGKTGNLKGQKNHDDLVIAAGLAIQAMKANKWYI